MVDIQSATAEIRRGKKKEEEEETGQKYNVRICYAGRPQDAGMSNTLQFRDLAWRTWS